MLPFAVDALAQAPEVPPDNSGYTWMIATGIVAGGHVGAGLTAGARGEWDENATWGAMLGGALGGATVVVIRPDGSYSMDDAVLLASGAGVGAWGGHMLALSLIPPGAQGEVGRLALAGVLGNMAGTGGALAAARNAPPARTLLRADLATLVAWQAAAGAMDLAALDPQDDRQVRASVSLLSGLGAGAGTLALARLQSQGPSASLLGLSMTQGAWTGIWAPVMLVDGPEEQQIWGGLRLGLGAGYLGAVALAPMARPDGRSTALQLAGIMGGNALGAGLPLAAGVDPDVQAAAVVAPMLAAGAAGQIYGALLSRTYEGGPSEAAIVSTVGLWTAWQSIGWGFYGSHAGVEDREAAGYGLVAAGLGTTLAMGVGPLLDVTPEGAAMAASGGMWGTWYGGWMGTILDLEPDAHWLLTLGASNAALVGSFASVHGREPSWLQVGTIDGFGAAGGAGGALIGVVASPDPDVVGACSLAGTTVGLGVGAWRASKGEPARKGSLGSLRLRLPTPQVQPWKDVSGGQGLWVGVREEGW
jgi:hypothetical protein